VTQYLDGHKVILSIGNLISAAISNVEVTLTYGEREPEFDVKDDDPKWVEKFRDHKIISDASISARKKVTERFASRFEPAKWTTIEIVVTNSKAADLGYLEVEINPSSISLHRAAK
jgi:hypothetical protein